MFSRSANKLCNFFLNIPFKEFTTSYRIYSNKCLRTLSKFKLDTEDYSAQIELFFYIYYSGLKCTEIPIHFKDRSKGNSKIPKLQIIYSIFKLVKLYFLKKKFKSN